MKKLLPHILVLLLGYGLAVAQDQAGVTERDAGTFFRAKSATVHAVDGGSVLIEAAGLDKTELAAKKVSVEIGTDKYRFWVLDPTRPGLQFQPYVKLKPKSEGQVFQEYLIAGTPGQEFQIAVLPYDPNIADKFIAITIPGKPVVDPIKPPVDPIKPPIDAGFEKSISDAKQQLLTPIAVAVKGSVAKSCREIAARHAEFGNMELMSRAWKDSNYAALGDKYPLWSEFFSAASAALFAEHKTKPMNQKDFGDYLVRMATVLER